MSTPYPYMATKAEACAVQEMFASKQPNNEKSPPITLASARSARVGIVPGRNRSMVFVTNKTSFSQLAPAQQQGLLHDRCILVLPNRDLPSPEFTTATLSRYVDPHVLSLIQGQCSLSRSSSGTLNPSFPDGGNPAQVFAAPASTLIGSSTPQICITPMPETNVPLPPGWQ